jgi:hypothetical protein
MVRAAIGVNVAQSGRPCTIAPSMGAHLYSLIGEADQMYECIDEALAGREVLGLYLCGG